MTPERWQQVKGVLENVLEIAPPERAAFLDQACNGDQALRQEVESLLASDDELAPEKKLNPEVLSDATLAVSGAATLPHEAEPWIGRRVGPYKIIEQIGIGGMGEVYRAVRDDEQYRKQVAIKVVRAGQDSALVVSRFKNERQILASLDHPNIARLLDGGTTTEGAAYLVMELIDGQPVDQYCDHHRLAVTERLKLFLQVCSAVQYAHQRLIIHRDIKPSNILVTSDGVPKLLDFGIAKLLDVNAEGGHAETTLTIFQVLTPAYASPEQVKGEPITTASDVYSLGVVLYELLTGSSPYHVASHSPQEMVRAVCEFEPERPSTALRRIAAESKQASTRETQALADSAHDGSLQKRSKRLSGDLDNIVLVALRKEPQRRYASVEQFAQDIQRHMDHLPVAARKDTAAYRASKFINRHKVGVAAAASVTIALLSATGVTLHQARIARDERARAERRFNDVRELARSNLFELHDAIQQLPDSAPARHLVIQRSLQYLDKLGQEAAGNRELLRELAVGYERIAGLQGNFSGPGIGDSKAALASYQKALSIRDTLAASSKDDPRELKAELPVLGGYLRCSITTGRTEEASRMARRELNIAEQIVQKQPHDTGARADAARAHLHLSTVLGGSGSTPSTREIPEAILHDRQALDILTQLAQAHSDARIQLALSIARLLLAFHMAKVRKFEESARLFDEIASDQKSLPASRDMSLTYNYWGLMFDRIGDPRRALAKFQGGSRIARSLVQADPHDLVAQLDVDIFEGDAGIEEARLGNKSAGLTQLKAATEDAERLLASNTSESFYKSLLIIGYSYQAEILSSMGDQAGARAKYSQALATAAAVSQGDPQDLESRLSIAKIHAAIGVVFAREARYADAQKEFSASLDVADELLRNRPTDAETLYLSGSVRDCVAAVKSCPKGSSCKNVSQLQVPNLNN